MTGREDTRPGRAVVIGADRPGAALVFGGALERVLTTTYDEMAADLEAERSASAAAGLPDDPIGFVGIAAGPGMQRAVDQALALLAAAAAGGRVLEVAVEVPWELDALDHLRDRLLEPDAPVLTAVRRYRDRPCVVVGGAAAPLHERAWVVDAVLTAGTTGPDARVAEQERVAAEWERASAQAHLAAREAELDRLRAELAQLRARPVAVAGGAGGPGPSPFPAPVSPRRVLAEVGRRAGGRGPRGGALVLALVALAALLVPAVVLALVAGEAGAAVGLALGVIVLVCGSVGGLVLLGQRRHTGQLAALQRSVDEHDRLAGQRAEQQHEAVERVERLAGANATAGVDDAAGDVVRREHVATRRHVQALLNLGELAPLRAGAPALGGPATSPDFALAVVDRLLADRPGLVVEAGGGAPTLLLAVAAREHGLDTRVVSLDHDARSAARTRRLLERHGVADHAEVRWAPLARTHVTDHLTPWYDEEALADLSEVSLLVVHGPPPTTGPAARYPAVPLLRERLAATCTILVEDSDREEDQEVVDRWVSLLPDFEREESALGQGATVLRRG